MLLYYVRHGDPIYNPNQLTPLGQRQAEAVGRRLATHGVDKIFSSPSNRAVQTAQPLCEMMKKEPIILDWADENLAFQELAIKNNEGKRVWCFRHPQSHQLLNRNDVRSIGRDWYTHPLFAETKFGEGMQRIQRGVDELLLSLGYRHDLESNCYYAEKPNDDRVAFFAHEGAGTAILSCMLDIPYPVFAMHFDMTHTGFTVIDFSEIDGVVIPKVLSYSNDSHLYREGLPTKHQNQIYY